jgi:hypothetical protein
MKTHETKLYSFSELSEEAKGRVISDIADAIATDDDNFTLSECVHSLKKLADALCVTLADWSIGPYNRGNRCSLRQSFLGDDEIDTLSDTGEKVEQWIWDCLKPKGYTPDQMKDGRFPGICGLTGVCFDDDIVESVLDSVRSGDTLSKAFDAAADRIMRICEDDLEYRTSREGILECLDKDEEVYTEEGERF